MKIFGENVLICDVFEVEYKNKEKNEIRKFPKMAVYSADVNDRGLTIFSVPANLFANVKNHIGKRADIVLVQSEFTNRETGETKRSLKLDKIDLRG